MCIPCGLVMGCQEYIYFGGVIGFSRLLRGVAGFWRFGWVNIRFFGHGG
jgi:hypothetical protein